MSGTCSLGKRLGDVSVKSDQWTPEHHPEYLGSLEPGSELSNVGRTFTVLDYKYWNNAILLSFK